MLRCVWVLGQAWPEAARPFASACPPGRVLDERYAAAGEPMLTALTERGASYTGLIVMIERDGMQERGLKPIAAEPEQVIGAGLHEATFPQIALLEPELINYCRQTRERAQALFRLVVCYVASADDGARRRHGRKDEGGREDCLAHSVAMAE